MLPVALTIAGSDPSGGAGIQADLKTFHQFGVYGASVVTLLTVQNTVAVESVDPLDADYVARQLRAVTTDIPPAAAKTGALGSAAIIKAVAAWAAQASAPLVVDPVMVSKHGTTLIPKQAVTALVNELLPQAYLVTPNLSEAAALTGHEVATPDQMREAAKRIAGAGVTAVLVKGGHLPGQALDILYFEGEFFEFSAPRLDTPHTHGTGCTYSAAITAGLAKELGLVESIRAAKSYVTRAIETAPRLGRGCGPVNHLASAVSE